MVTAALLTKTKTWKQPKCPSTEECVKEDVVHLYNGILLSHKKQQNNATCSNMEMNLEIIILTEVSPRERERNNMILPICGT